MKTDKLNQSVSPLQVTVAPKSYVALRSQLLCRILPFLSLRTAWSLTISLFERYGLAPMAVRVDGVSPGRTAKSTRKR
jgi:hypothetical protein